MLWLGAQSVALSPPLIVAHRGYSPGMRENTMAAFRHAIGTGVYAIELDLRATADGQPVVMHDPTVDRTTNGSGAVAGMTLDQIWGLDAGSKTGAAFAGERVPSFADVLTLVGPSQARLLIDVKTSWNMSLADVIRSIREHGMVDRVIVGVRTLDDLRQVKAAEPRIATLALIPTPLSIDAFADAGADSIRLWFPDRLLPIRLPRGRRPLGWSRRCALAARNSGSRPAARCRRDGARLQAFHHLWLACEPVDVIPGRHARISCIDIERAVERGQAELPGRVAPGQLRRTEAGAIAGGSRIAGRPLSWLGPVETGLSQALALSTGPARCRPAGRWRGSLRPGSSGCTAARS